MADFEALHDVLLDQQDRNAVGIDAPNQREQFLDQQRRQAERRLVENHQLGFGHQAAADGEHLLLAARQRAGALRTALAQAREDRKHALAVLRAARAGAPVAAEIEILAHREIGEDAPALRHMDKSARDDRGRLLTRRRRRRRSGSRRACARTMPERVRLSVDLPTPLEPSTATISPGSTVRSMPRNTSVSP